MQTEKRSHIYSHYQKTNKTLKKLTLQQSRPNKTTDMYLHCQNKQNTSTPRIILTVTCQFSALKQPQANRRYSQHKISGHNTTATSEPFLFLFFVHFINPRVQHLHPHRNIAVAYGDENKVSTEW